MDPECKDLGLGWGSRWQGEGGREGQETGLRVNEQEPLAEREDGGQGIRMCFHVFDQNA